MVHVFVAQLNTRSPSSIHQSNIVPAEHAKKHMPQRLTQQLPSNIDISAG